MEKQIKELARAEGAQLVAFVPAARYRDYLTVVKTRMRERALRIEDYMIDKKNTTFFEGLSDPATALPSVRSVIIVGVYSCDDEPAFANAENELRGKIARTYAYYPVARKIADSLAAYIREELGYDALQGQHVPLKQAAERAGLGRYGKNGILLTEQYGSYVALRSVLTSAPLKSCSKRPADMCGSCRACISACPTGALYAPYMVDPTLCINPLTRSGASIPPHLRHHMRNWIRGCDICQEVCPRNQGLTARKSDPRAGFDPEHHSSHRDLRGLEKTPKLLPLLEESVPHLIRRNAAIALGNIGRGREEAVAALQERVETGAGWLSEYFRWALEKTAR